MNTSASIENVKGIFARLGEEISPESEGLLSEFVADQKTQEVLEQIKKWETVLMRNWCSKLNRNPGCTGSGFRSKSRAIPVYLLLDTSGSMRGEPIAAVNNGLQTMVARLKQDRRLQESVHISIITFDGQVRQVLPLTLLRDLTLPEIVCPESGPTNMGSALMMLLEKSRADRFGSDEWRPMVYLMTDGGPSDLGVFREAVAKMRSEKFLRVVACAVGADAKDRFLQELTDTVLHLDTVDSATLTGFIEFIGDSISLPEPPREVHIIF